MTFAFSSDERSLIYLTLGGSAFSAATFRTLIDALSTRGDWNAVLSLGPNIDRSHLPSDSGNLIIRQFVPGLKICALADVVVCAGNHETVMQALAYGKPMISIPMNIDQACFATRLEELGAGVNLNPMNLLKLTKREAYVEGSRHLAAQRVTDAIRKVLCSKCYSEGARNLREEIGRYPKSGQSWSQLD